jgi:HSP20 family protein
MPLLDISIFRREIIMSEQKFDPVKEFINIRDSISKTIGQSLKNAAGIAPDFPAVDVYETDDEVVVCTEPILGIVASSVEISMEDEILTIGGETHSDQEIPESAYIRNELVFGPFSRAVAIPRAVEPGKASASLKNGILTVKLPKVAKKTEQIIEVTPTE